MAGRLEGRVALITGAARGQGRSHAVLMAEEGADIIAVDICEPIDGLDGQQLGTEEDLAETVRLVEATGARIVASKADVRDFDVLDSAVTAGVETLGRLDIVSANAGVVGGGPAHLIGEKTWDAVVDTLLTGVWHTAKAAIPHLIDGGRGGSITITASAVTAHGMSNLIPYMAAKNGCIGIMHALATELGAHRIRVNTIHPTMVSTPMVMNEGTWRHHLPDVAEPTRDDFDAVMLGTHLLPIPYIEAIDVSRALVFLASDDARYITGIELPIDAGSQIKH